MPGLGDHFVAHFLDVEVELLGAGLCIGAENGHVQRIGFRREGDRFTDDARVLLQHFGRCLGAGKRDRVLAGEVIEEVADAAADQLHAAFRENARFDDAPNHQLGQVSRARRRLDDGRHAGKECGREFFEHAPTREIERVDVDCGAELGREDVLA